MSEISLTEWVAFIDRYPDPHLLQTSTWGQLKADFGWRPIRVIADGCGAQILVRQILPGLTFAYIPKGPIGVVWDSLWPEIDAICRRNRCAFLKVEPDLWTDDHDQPVQPANTIPDNFVLSHHSIQPMRTLVVDIRGDEAQILARMKQKTRYNINLAVKKNIIVKHSSNLNDFYDLMEITGQRDQFGIHSLAYYQRAYDLFHSKDQCELLVAEFEGQPISALLVFRSGRRAWYFYGASSNVHRDRMPSYLLQWEAIRWAKSYGCEQYDLWGVPDADLDTLEANFQTRHDGLWGVYRFKRGFGGTLKRSSGPWDRIYNPFLYRIYSLWLKYRKVEG